MFRNYLTRKYIIHDTHPSSREWRRTGPAHRWRRWADCTIPETERTFTAKMLPLTINLSLYAIIIYTNATRFFLSARFFKWAPLKQSLVCEIAINRFLIRAILNLQFPRNWWGTIATPRCDFRIIPNNRLIINLISSSKGFAKHTSSAHSCWNAIAMDVSAMGEIIIR